MYCPIPVPIESTTNPPLPHNSSEHPAAESNTAIQAWKKTRRGCRGGKKRRTVTGQTVASPPSTEEEPVVQTWTLGTQQQRFNSTQPTQALVTVGERLVHRARRQGERHKDNHIERTDNYQLENPTSHPPMLTAAIDEMRSQELSDTVGPQESSQRTLASDEVGSRTEGVSRPVTPADIMWREHNDGIANKTLAVTDKNSQLVVPVTAVASNKALERAEENSESDKTSFLGAAVPEDCGLRHHFRSRRHLTVVSSKNS